MRIPGDVEVPNLTSGGTSAHQFLTTPDLGKPHLTVVHPEDYANPFSDYKPVPPLNDPVTRPAHYTSHPSGVECLTIAKHMNFCLGNVLKYIWRADMKGGIEDLKKARFYLDREIERRGNGFTK